MTQPLPALVATLIATTFAAAPATPVVGDRDATVIGDVAGTPVTWGDLLPLLPGDPSEAPPSVEAIGEAFETAARERLVALEAHQQLGDRAAGLADPAAARLLLDTTFSPTNVCSRPRPALLDAHYRETAWRFVAPPAWRVADIQLLCCRSPSDCRRPEVAACLDAQAAEAKALLTRLPREAPLDQLQAWARQLAETEPRLAFKVYTYYHQPDARRRAAEKVHWRLQTVDEEIGVAVETLAPGDVAGPVRSRFGHHILRLESTREGIELRSDDPRTRALIIAELCPAWMATARERFVQSVRSQVTARLDVDAIKGLLTRPPPPAP